MKAPIIIITDDDTINRMIIGKFLENYPYKKLEAANGKIAIDLIHKNPNHPVILLLDLNMPVMDGYEVLHALNLDASLKERSICTLVITASDYNVLDKSGLQKLINGFIQKPVNKKELISKMDVCLEKAENNI